MEEKGWVTCSDAEKSCTSEPALGELATQDATMVKNPQNPFKFFLNIRNIPGLN
jgi:hypothetical protein